ncbi:pentatricopeptide repeat-containing protein At1g76280 [Prosopis cineraria]|uniref:pentatricopeptide repeat-containing protein At1g76280 n=1 Tax=Prosopis cineraria TaxID=364024 RepID=UPI00240F4914|nr:pentatricopeptide repeat-containing protein At1g76280 [Prosopis cineraria]
MHAFRARVALRSTAESLCKSKWHQYGDELTESCVFNELSAQHEVITCIDFVEPGAGSTTRVMQMQIIDALRLGERRRASNLLLEFGYGSHSLRADDFVDIMNYCARSPDPLFVMEIWRLMEARDISFNHKCSSLMMQALCRGGYLEEAFNMMNFLRETQQFYPVLSLYNSFLKGCTKMQSITHASKCLDLMEKHMVGNNEVTYTLLLKLAVLRKNLSAVHQIWKEYVKHYSISIIALREFIWSFRRLGDLTSAFKALQRMVSLANNGDIYDSKDDGKFSTKHKRKNEVNEKLYSTRLDIPIPLKGELGSTILDMKENKQVDPCMRPLLEHSSDVDSASIEAKSVGMCRLNGQEYPEPIMKVLRRSFNDVMHACAQGQNYALAEQLILQMQNLGLQPSSYTYDGFIRAAVSERGFREGLEMLKILRQKKLKPYDSTLTTLSVSCSKALELDLAEALLYQISKCRRPYPFNALLALCDKMNKPERAVRVLAKMKQMNIAPNIRTYELLFKLFTNVNPPYEKGNMISQVEAAKRINAIESDMVKNDIHHSYRSLKSLLRALGEEGMIREMTQYLHVAENLFIHKDPTLGTAIYNIVLQSLVVAEESHMAIAIFKKMKLYGFQLSPATFNIMIDCCSIPGCFRSASLLVSIMIREGFYPNTPTYTALIKVLLKDENFNEALNLLDLMRSDGVKLDVLVFNTILRKACDKGRIDVIEFLVECMHREGILPDPTTCSSVFCAYVDSGFHNTAIQALQVLSMLMLGGHGDIDEEKRKLVNEFILAEDLAVESRILEFFKESKENFAVALLNLRWCAIAGFPMCWSADQSLWARRLRIV